MLGTRNPNHRGVVVRTLAPVIEEEDSGIDVDIEKYFYGLTKDEQIIELKDIGVTEDEIRKLRYEKDRVKKLVKFYKN